MADIVSNVIRPVPLAVALLRIVCPAPHRHTFMQKIIPVGHVRQTDPLSIQVISNVRSAMKVIKLVYLLKSKVNLNLIEIGHLSRNS